MDICLVIKFWKRNKRENLEYKLGNSHLQISGIEKDLGVIIYKLKPIYHINEKEA